jgi:hypothetical protein
VQLSSENLRGGRANIYERRNKGRRKKGKMEEEKEKEEGTKEGIRLTKGNVLGRDLLLDNK